MVDFVKTHTIFHYIGCWLLCVSISVFLMAIVVGVALFDTAPYTRYINKDSFMEHILPLSKQAIEAECLFYGVPPDLFEGEPFASELYSFAQQQLTETQATVHNRIVLPTTPDPTRYCRAVDSFLNTLPAEDRPSDTTVSQTIGTSIAQAAYGSVQLSLPPSVVALVRDTTENSLLNSLTASWPWWIVLIALALWLGTVYGPSPTQRWYRLSLAAAVGSAMVFVPIWLLQWYDLPSRLSIGESMMTWSFDAIYTAKMNQLLLITGIVTAVTTGSLVVSAAFVTKSSQSKD